MGLENALVAVAQGCRRLLAGAEIAEIGGKAKLLIEAQANDLRALADSRQIEFEVISAPPKLAADGFQHYINQGGCELAVGTISGYWTEAGVRVGPYSFRTFPLPGSKTQEQFSLFAFADAMRH